jgi:uncharacterized protein (TIGR03435 family)
MPPARTLAALCTLLTLPASAQTAAPIAHVFHPAAPVPSYDVATIKPYVYNPPGPGVMCCGTTVREYIRDAYAPTFARLVPAQVVGGPDWIDKEKYSIEGKPAAELEAAMQKMRTEEKTPQQHMMEQSLLADRFHLKIHFEVREMPVYAFVPAKGGLKIKKVEAPAPRDLNSPSSSPPDPDHPLGPGTTLMMIADNERIVKARATTMARFIAALSNNLHETGDRPVVDRTGFTGYFDVDELRWAALDTANPSESPDLPSLPTALEETLGIKLVATKSPVEVVVIDSIDHPSEN